MQSKKTRRAAKGNKIPLTPPVSIRTSGLKLSDDMRAFLKQRRETRASEFGPVSFGCGATSGFNANTPIFMQETRELFVEKFESRIIDTRDAFWKLGLTDIWVEECRKALPSLSGDIDKAIENFVVSIRHLSFQVKEPNPYSNDSDAILAQKASEEVKTVSSLLANTYAELIVSRTPNANRQFFYNNFKECCFENVEDLRIEMLKRLGPVNFDREEMQAFNAPLGQGFTNMGENQRSAFATVGLYWPKFTALTQKFIAVAKTMK